MAPTDGSVLSHRHRAGEHSLRLMRTDYLDLVQFHRSLTPAEFHRPGVLDTALALRDEGKVRFVGVSGTLPNLVDQINMGVFDVFQIPYSCLQREHEAAAAHAGQAGAGVIIRGGVARGAPTDWEHRSPGRVEPETVRKRWEEARLDELLDGMDRMEFVLRFTLAHPEIDATIVGTADLEHLRANVAAAVKGPLPEDVVAEAKRRLEALG